MYRDNGEAVHALTRAFLTQAGELGPMKPGAGRPLKKREKFVWFGRASPARTTRISSLLRGTTWAEARGGRLPSLRHNIPKQEKGIFDISKRLT